MNPRPTHLLSGLLSLVIVLLAVESAGACTVPVFRYALERWPADPYEVLIYTRGEEGASAEAVTKLVAGLDEAREAHPLYANVEPRVIDVEHADDVDADELLQPWRGAGEPELPWVAVTYPFSRYGPMPAFLEPREHDEVWTGPLAELKLDTLLDSPARREIARRLLKGDSVVWLVVESGDKAADDAAATQLEVQLRRLEGVLELPEIAESDQRYISEGGPALKLAFSELRVSREDAAEAGLLAMIDHMEQDVPRDQPVIVPVYGRGRLLCALPAPPLEAKLRVPTPMGYRTLLDMSQSAMVMPQFVEQLAVFLTSECSCEVKHLNPGTDALMAAGWDNFIDGSFVVDEAMPQLTSLPTFTAADLATAQLPAVQVKAPEPVSLQEVTSKAESTADSQPDAKSVLVAVRATATPAPAVAVTESSGGSFVWLVAGVVGVAAVLALLLGTVLLMRRGAA